MILTLEILSIWLGLSLIVAAVLTSCARRLKKNMGE